jgi:hypothetical protein
MLPMALNGKISTASYRTTAGITGMRLQQDRRRNERRSEKQNPILTLMGMLWALPLTILGLLLAFPVWIARGKAYAVKESTPALLVRGPFGDWLLAHHPFGPMTAMAIGHVVLAERKGLSRTTLVHELAHVKQAARWGILFPFAYIASSMWALLRGQDAYWNNAFEVAARDAERRA